MLTLKIVSRAVGIIFMVLFCSGCLIPKDYIKYDLRIDRVDASDGIDASEAVFIAREDIFKEGLQNNCNINKPKVFDEQDSWQVMFDSTFKDWSRGFFWHCVRINKKTGDIISRGVGPDL